MQYAICQKYIAYANSTESHSQSQNFTHAYSLPINL